MEELARVMREIGAIPTMLALIGVLLLWSLVLDAVGSAIDRLRKEEK